MTLRVSPWLWPLILAINTFTLIGVSGIAQEGWGFFWCLLVVFGIASSIFLAGGYVAVASSGRLYCIDFLRAFGKLWVEGADIEHWGLAMTTGAFFVSYSGQVTLKNGHVGQVKAVAGYSRRRVQRSLDRLVETVRSGSQ